MFLLTLFSRSISSCDLGSIGAAVLPAQWWSAYVSPAGPYAGLTAGMRLFGAYVGTVFGDCTFQITDFFEREPVKIYFFVHNYGISLVAVNCAPCVVLAVVAPEL